MKIILTKSGEEVFVDDGYFEMLNKHKWYTCKKHNGNYAIAYIDKRLQQMHRLLMGVTDPKIQVDHRDSNGLNNQTSNLRICNNSDNARNRAGWGKSKHKGVTIEDGKFCAKIILDGKRKRLGAYHSEKEAALAVNRAIIQSGNKFFRLNQV